MMNASKPYAHRVLYDAPGDGSLWARGAAWKASFDAAGVTYYPAFGKSAPHDIPHAFSPDSVTVGGTPLVFERTVSAARDADRITIARGPFVEAYDLTPETVEQSFVFSALPQSGDLVVHIPVASEMPAVETADGVEFQSELGRITYSSATVVDALGHRAAASTHLEDGAITIRVDAAFLAEAKMPLVIDPFITTIFFPGITNDDFQPDIAYDPFNQVWLATYAETFTATDIDAYGLEYSTSGALLNSFFVDVTTASWQSVRCADCAAANEFLVVAENISGTTHSVRGRLVTPNGTLVFVGLQFVISDGSTGAKTAPSVGGDPFSIAPSNFCVAYVQELTGGSSSIAVVLVSSAAIPSAPMYLANIAGQPDTAPSVSKSDDSSTWLSAWRRSNGIALGDIWAAQVRRDGVLTSPPFGVTSGVIANDFAPCASSPLHGSTQSAIAFGRNIGISANHEIMVAALDGATVLQIVDLNAMEPNGDPLRDQTEPAIDSDGRHFLVSYSEKQPITGTYDVLSSDLYLSGSVMGLSESHVPLHTFGLDEHSSRSSAAHDADSTSQRFFTVFDVLENSTDHDADGVLFDVVAGGAATVFCSGNGTGTACPCGNNGAAEHGCANSVFSTGGELYLLAGTPSSINDTVHLEAAELPPGAACLLFQGTTAGAGAVFGDGLRCATGTIIRIAPTTASSLGLFVYPPGVADVPISVKGGVPANGGTRTYQVWYRNAAAFCTPSTFNLTNGLRIDWAR
jgi:hypothetical protein